MLRLRLNKNGSNSPSNGITSASQDDSYRYRPSSPSNLKKPLAADCYGPKLKISPPPKRSISMCRSITSSSYGSNDHEQHHYLSPLKISSSHDVNQAYHYHGKVSPRSALFIFMALTSFAVGTLINWKEPYEGHPRCATFETMPQHSSPHVNRHFRALWSSNFQHSLSPLNQENEEDLVDMDKTGQSVDDSNDDQQNKGVRKVTGYSEDCVPKAPWQTASYPTCNNIHEIDFGDSVGRDILSHIFAEQQTGRRFVTNYSSSKSLQQKQEVDLELKGQGWFRTAWLVDRKTSPFKVEYDDDERAAEYRRDEQLVLKTLRLERDFSEELYELHRRDAMAMERLTQSPYVMHIYGYCGQSALNEFANGGTLETMLHSGVNNTKNRLKLAYEVAKGLSDVHSIDYADFTPPRDGSGVSLLTNSNATMVHYDLNRQNVVVVDGIPKLNDFNVAMFLSWDPKKKATCGFEGRLREPWWRSPEEMQNLLDDGTDNVPLTEKVDIYSLGNILWVILTNSAPWKKEKMNAIRSGSLEATMDELRPRVARGDMPNLPSKIANSTEPTIIVIKNAMSKCLRVNPEERASAGEVAHDLKMALEEVNRLEKEEKERNKTADKASYAPGRDLRIAWLLSFPNSGTSYTSELVRMVTLTNTASNYGHECVTEDSSSLLQSAGIFADNPIPSWTVTWNNRLQQPSKGYILTKTHCGGFSFCKYQYHGQDKYCDSQIYNSHTFLKKCLEGDYVTGDATSGFEISKGLASKDKIARAVHIIRDPFDNLVARFHLERKTLAERNLAHYPNTREGFREFCDDLGKIGKGRSTKAEKQAQKQARFFFEDVLDLDIPCQADFYRYIQWHNMAFTTTWDLGIPTLIVHYESYTNNFNKTKADLLQFLEQDEVNDAPTFITGKRYKDYYTADEIDAVSKMFDRLALRETAMHTKHYFVQ